MWKFDALQAMRWPFAAMSWSGDAGGAGGPRGATDRAGVLALLEQGMISTEEALDLLDGLDQVAAATPRRESTDGRAELEAGLAAMDLVLDEMDRSLADVPGGERKGRRGRPPRPARPPRPTRPDRPERPDWPAAPGAAWFGDKRTFRVQVDDADGSKVNLALPIGFVDTGLRVAERFSPGLLDGAVGTSIRRAIGGGQAGTIIEVDDGRGQHVRIAIE